jgi:hypothetical protein
MKTFLLIFALVVLLNEAGRCDQTEGYTSHLQTQLGSYTWEISAARLTSTPQWNSETQPVPLSVDKACQLGWAWLAGHHFQKFNLDEARLQSYPNASIAAMTPGSAPRRFFYWLMYRSGDFDGGFMYVYVLMDGTVVEPTLTPTKAQKK